jgi:hypothetical protein
MTSSEPEWSSGAAHRTRLLSFNEAEFLPFVVKLRRTYPGEWVALGIIERNDETGQTSARVIAHNTAEEFVLEAAKRYREENPQATVRLLTTDMVLSPPI